jgi:OOP family OmpA-OmpF porin
MSLNPTHPPYLRSVLLCLAVLGFLLLQPSAARAQDIEGSRDHPTISRYAGSYIDGYDYREYDRFVLALGKPTRDAAGNRVAEKSQELEGKVTRILYRTPEARSVFEVFRNYEMALEGAGFQILYKCLPAECGRYYHYVVYPPPRRFTKTRSKGSGFDLPGELHYLAAKATTATGTTYVSLLVGMDLTKKYPSTLLEVIETTEMEQGMVKVDAAAIGTGIDATGHMSIYSIYFDTGSAQVRPESAATLAEIAKLLGQRPALKLLVVGHTDNQGGYDFNLDLSRRRAEAVAQALVSEHGVAPDRLRAAGVGYLSPVASNDTEAGRAKNRRVELVKP